MSEIALATWIEQKYDHALPLYRLERIAKGANVDLARESLARWIIQVSQKYFQPFINLINDAVIDYDIICIDETTLQVLREPGRAAETKSQLWIRRGGPPGKESIVIDYSPSRSAATCQSYIEGFQGYIVSDAYAAYLKLGKKKKFRMFYVLTMLVVNLKKLMKTLIKNHVKDPYQIRRCNGIKNYISLNRSTKNQSLH